MRGCAALALLFLALPAAAEDKKLNVYNWADYIGSTTIADFEQATGIAVVYDTYETDAELEAKMMAGGSGYDVVSTATPYFDRQIKAGVYQVLDRSLLPHWRNLDPAILEVEGRFDPGNAHAVPYMQGSNGFAYDVAAIEARLPNAPTDSLDMLFKPEVVAKFADCGVTLLDSARDVLQFAFSYLHLDPNTTRPEDFQAAEKLLLAVRPYIRGFDSAGTINALVTRESCIAMVWSGDFAIAQSRAQAARIPLQLAYTVPKEGATGWYDAWLIPAGAPHPAAAHAFLDFLLDPKVIAKITNELHYANDNRAANDFVDPKILADPAFYPTPEIRKRLYLALPDASPAVERLRTRVWTRIKTGL